MSQINARTIDFKAVQNIISKRKTIRLSDINSLIKVHIQSNGGTTLPVTDKSGMPVMGSNGQPLYKTIYNVAANSQIAMTNERNRKLLSDAVQAESAGEMVQATELFNKYLNAIQVSFNVLLTGANPVKFGKNDQIKATVQLITTENGQLITLDKVSMVEARELADTQKFTINELLGIADEANPEDVFKADTALTEKADA